jgi:hypothetical protein
MKSTPQGTRYEVVTDLEGNAVELTVHLPLTTEKTSPSKSGATVGHSDLIPNSEVTLDEDLMIEGINLKRRFNLGVGINLWLKPIQVNLQRRTPKEKANVPNVQFKAAA